MPRDKHTGGEWQACGRRVESRLGGGKWAVVGTAHVDDVPEAQAAENARLFAAAPDLLRACREYLRAFNADEGTEGVDYAQHEMVEEMARAAIAKAQGETL